MGFTYTCSFNPCKNPRSEFHSLHFCRSGLLRFRKVKCLGQARLWSGQGQTLGCQPTSDSKLRLFSTAHETRQTAPTPCPLSHTLPTEHHRWRCSPSHPTLSTSAKGFPSKSEMTNHQQSPCRMLSMSCQASASSQLVML